MKKTFFIGLAIFLIGGVLLAIGLGQGGFKSTYWHNGIRVDSKVSRTTNIKQVDHVTINGGDFGSVLIHRGNVAKVSIHANKSSNIKTNVSHNQLTITGHGKHAVFFGDFDSSDQAHPVEVTVPKSTQIKNLTLNGSTEVRVDQLSIEQVTNRGNGDLTMLNADITKKLSMPDKVFSDVTLENVTSANGLHLNTAGDVTIKDSKFNGDSSQIRTSDGDVVLSNNKWSNLDVSTSDGDILLGYEKIADTLKADSTGGDINARIMRKSNTTITGDSSAGDVYLYGKKSHKYGHVINDKAKYRLTTSDGDISVRN